ncbi:MAG: dephospho-CoA kinase [Rhodoferax sp.]
MLRLGITGGIGSGKSTVAALLARFHGAVLLDADAIARATTAPAGIAIGTIRAAFGAQAIGPDGALDREFMRALVFQDPRRRQELEDIIHPLVRQEFERQDRQARDKGCQLAVYDIPLLVEGSHWRSMLDAILVVDCSPATQIERVRQRDGLSPQRIESIMQAQAPRLARLGSADAVLHNDTRQREELVNSVRQLGTIWRLPQP